MYGLTREPPFCAARYDYHAPGIFPKESDVLLGHQNGLRNFSKNGILPNVVLGKVQWKKFLGYECLKIQGSFSQMR